MLEFKRKINNEKDRYVGFDSVIELDEDKSKSYGESFSYSSRERSKTPVMPSIHSTSKAKKTRAAAKHKDSSARPLKEKTEQTANDVISLKAKVMLSVYITIAVALAAIVIGSGVAISGAASRANDIEARVALQNAYIAEQLADLEKYDDDIWMRGYASDPEGLNMESVDDVSVFPVIPMAEPIEYSESSNWFDRICDFISQIFN